MNASNNVTINVTPDQQLVVTVAGKDYHFDRNKAKVGIVNHGQEFPFPIFEGIRAEIEKNNWVGSYVSQEFDGKQAAVIMAGDLEDMKAGKETMVWFTDDVQTDEAAVTQPAELISKDGTITTYKANGKKFCFDDTIAQTGAFIREDGLGVVLPAVICQALAKPCRMAVYKYQGDTLMIEVYKAPRAWTDHSDGIWIIEDVTAINPSTN